jgi:hypothetical protein
MKKFIISEEEKNRILEMHQSATSRQYLTEQNEQGNNQSGGDGRDLLAQKWSGKKISKNAVLETWDSSQNIKVSGKNYDIFEFRVTFNPALIEDNYNHFVNATYKYNPSKNVWYDQNGEERSGEDLQPTSVFRRHPGEAQGEWDSNYATKNVFKQLLIGINSPFIRDFRSYLGEKPATNAPSTPTKP